MLSQNLLIPELKSSLTFGKSNVQKLISALSSDKLFNCITQRFVFFKVFFRFKSFAAVVARILNKFHFTWSKVALSNW